MSTDSLNECRSAFEKWCIATMRNITPSIVLGSYQDMYVCMAWHGWQAAWEAREPKAKPYVRERYCDEPGRGY